MATMPPQKQGGCGTHRLTLKINSIYIYIYIYLFIYIFIYNIYNLYMYIYLRAKKTKTASKEHTKEKKTTGCTTFRDTTHTCIHNIPRFFEEFQI